MLRPLECDSLIDKAVTTIQDFILDSGMTPGGRLPSERKMAEGMLVSRVTVRQALAILEGQGIIERKRGCGAVVGARAGVGHRRLRKKLRVEAQRLREIRLAIEFGAVEFACRRRTKEQLKKLGGIIAEMDKVERHDRRASVQDAEFHVALITCAGPHFAAAFEDTIKAFFRLAAQADPSVLTARRRIDVTRHRRMLEALQKRDSQTLRFLLLESADSWEKFISAGNGKVLSGSDCA